ncbi:MAG: ABC1 kinase family protein [Phycisphaerales bacterium]
MSTTPAEGTPNLADLMDALPVDDDRGPSAELHGALDRLVADLARRPAPVGRVHRAWILGSMPAKVAAAYLAWWLRSRFDNAAGRERRLAETRLRAAFELLARMSYLRGAAMKAGQALAAYPSVVPTEFAELLGRLSFEAPPMHLSLVREVIRRDLNAEPEDLFAEFEPKAFAAASFGQVHRARVSESGPPLAVKVQYPNMARTIRSDMRNLRTVSAPMRLTRDWDNTLLQLDDIAETLERETDYKSEASYAATAREYFESHDEVVVPRIDEARSGARVLTMEYLPGAHLREYLGTDPPQEDRNRRGRQITEAVLALSYKAGLLYADPQPGNFIFMPDGRLGLIDFGCCRRLTEADIEYFTEVEEAAMSGDDDAGWRSLIRGTDLPPSRWNDKDRRQWLMAYRDWMFEPVRHEGPFDFGAESYFRRGVALYGECTRRWYTRSLPINTWLARSVFGVRAMLTQLRAQIDYRAIWLRYTPVRIEE